MTRQQRYSSAHVSSESVAVCSPETQFSVGASTQQPVMMPLPTPV